MIALPALQPWESHGWLRLAYLGYYAEHPDFGAGLLATTLGVLCWRLLTDPGDTLHRKTYTTQPMLLITAVALLAPVLAPHDYAAQQLPKVLLPPAWDARADPAYPLGTDDLARM